MTIDTAIKAAEEGKALLVLGAGFSYDVINLNNDTMPLAAGLKERLCSDLQVSPEEANKLTLDKVSEIYKTEYGDSRLISLLETCYRTKTFSPNMADDNIAQKVIAGLPWWRVYTTNYDNAFELASSQCSINRTPITPSREIKEYIERNLIVHINGFIDSLSSSTLLSEFRLSSTSYLLEEFERTDWFKLLQSDIDSVSAVVLIGVSFDYDLDLKRLIYNAPQFHEKVLFIDRIMTDEEIKEKYFNYEKLIFGNVENIGLSAFADSILKINAEFVPSSDSIRFECFNMICQDVDVPFKKVHSTDLRQLLLKGVIDSDLLYFNRQDNEYLFRREETDNLMNCIENNTIRCFCVTSGLANGKTCFCYYAAYELQTKGIDVFFYVKSNDNLSAEIAYFKKVTKKTVLIIESYNLYLRLLYKLKAALYNPNIILILTARTAIYESTQYRIAEGTGLADDDILEINLDRLSNCDIPKANILLKKADFLLEERGHNAGNMYSIFKNKYKSEMSNVLLEELKSQNVRDEISDLYNEIDQIPYARDIVIASFILDVLNISLSLNSLLNLLETKDQSNKVLNNSSLNQLLDISNGCIRAHSSAFAKYVLNEKGSKYVIDLLYKMNKNAERLYNESEIYAVRSAFVTFSNINMLLPEKTRTKKDKADIMEYYYNMGQIHVYDTNPFFWLQYAIACMDNLDYERADTMLKKAYGCADEMSYDFDTFQIDTQEARFILESSLANHNPDINPYEVFLKANSLLLKAANSKKNKLEQVIKQVVIYSDFFDTFGSEFTTQQNNSMLEAVKTFESMIEEHNQEAIQRGNPILIRKSYSLDLRKLREKILLSAVQ